MKRLIIAAAVICSAAISYGAAASWNWGVGGSGPSQVWYDKSATALAENTVIYLFDAAEVSQQDLLDSLRAGKSITGEVKTSKLDSSSKLITVSNFEHGENSASSLHSYNFYMAVIKGDDVFVTESVPVDASAMLSAEDIGFTGISTATQKDFTANTSAAFAAGGWYSAAVPEPTSGLMLLLGIGLMSLKRKRV